MEENYVNMNIHGREKYAAKYFYRQDILSCKMSMKEIPHYYVVVKYLA
jgi:hypothetical protein